MQISHLQVFERVFIFLSGGSFFLILSLSCHSSATSSFPRDIVLPTDSLTYRFHLETVSDSLAILSTASESDRQFRDFRIPFPVYQLQIGDLNRNRQPDALIGVEKSTPFDSVVRRRLFIYELRGNHFHKLWEGSRLVHPLSDFRLDLSPDPPEVRSMEYEKNGLYLIARYRLGNFGLDFIDYLARDLDSLQAAKMLSP